MNKRQEAKIRIADLEVVKTELLESECKPGLWKKEIISIDNAIKFIKKLVK